jgi:hypothetical protein
VGLYAPFAAEGLLSAVADRRRPALIHQREKLPTIRISASGVSLIVMVSRTTDVSEFIDGTIAATMIFGLLWVSLSIPRPFNRPHGHFASPNVAFDWLWTG